MEVYEAVIWELLVAMCWDEETYSSSENQYVFRSVFD
jgi:hypothetical protein